MNIAVVSDTHGNSGVWRDVHRTFAQSDLIIHAGDVVRDPYEDDASTDDDTPSIVEAMNSSMTPIVVVRGNCDPDKLKSLLKWPVHPSGALVERGGLRIFVTHGDHLRDRAAMISLAKRHRADFLISGHTHRPQLERVHGVVLMNPGSPAYQGPQTTCRLSQAWE